MQVFFFFGLQMQRKKMTFGQNFEGFTFIAGPWHISISKIQIMCTTAKVNVGYRLFQYYFSTILEDNKVSI